MNGITLTTQQVADLQAYLATLSSGAGGSGGGGGGSGTGSTSAGQTLFSQSCAGCHSAASLAPFASSITTDLGTVASAMNGITLTTQQVADLQAYLATLASGGGGSGDSDGDDDGD